MSEATVKRVLSWAKKAELIVEIEDKILQELVPQAHRALLAALQDTDKPQEAGKLALELFNKTIPSFKKDKKADSSAPTDDLAKYIEQFRAGEGLIEGEVAGDAENALPAAEETDSPQRLSLPAGGDTTGDGIEPPAAEVLGELGDQRANQDVEGGEA